MAGPNDNDAAGGPGNGADVLATSDEAVAEALLRLSGEIGRLRAKLETQRSSVPPETGAKVTRKLVVCSDGTGNSSAKAEKTNVWRIFEALDQNDPNQLAYYDNGVGTSRYKYLALLGGAFGFGLKRNVIDLYKFICRNYRPGDKIYCFGFSRGAFTIRMLVGLIDRMGLVDTPVSEHELDRLAHLNYKAFRRDCFKVLPASPVKLYRWLEDRFARMSRLWRKDVPREHKSKQVPFEFLGLWDTVGAYGMPIAELQPAIEWLCWPMQFNNTVLTDMVKRCCHALSLDDERTTFHPIVFDESKENDRKRISQVWFSGVHSNVGGGYPEDRLSLVSLDWMLGELAKLDDAARLKFRADYVNTVAAEKSAFGRLYDSRGGTGIFYRYSPRTVEIPSSTDRVVPVVDSSVIERMALGGDGYAPSTLPSEFRVRTPDGDVLTMSGFATRYNGADEMSLAMRQTMEKLLKPDTGFVHRVLDLIWLRHKAYFLSMLFVFAIVLFPLYDESLHAALASEGFDHLDKLISGLLVPSMMQDSLSALVPSELATWVEAAAAQPIEFIFFALLWAGSMRWNVALRGRLHDLKALAWRPDDAIRGPKPALPVALHERAARVFREMPVIPKISVALIRHGLPVLFIAVVFYGLSAGVSRLIFETGSAAGFYCPGSQGARVMGATAVSLDKQFDTASVCWSSGQVLMPNTLYRVVLDTGDSEWTDQTTRTGPAGFWPDSVASPHFIATPFKRLTTVPWFRPVARVGSKGDEEYLFEPCMSAENHKVMAEFIPRRKGELFLYVNDAVFFGTTGRYANNHGKARVTITPVTQGNETAGCIVRPKS